MWADYISWLSARESGMSREYLSRLALTMWTELVWIGINNICSKLLLFIPFRNYMHHQILHNSQKQNQRSKNRNVHTFYNSQCYFDVSMVLHDCNINITLISAFDDHLTYNLFEKHHLFFVHFNILFPFITI